MVKAAEELADNIEDQQQPEIDSKYRLIILAAKRSKQLQRGAHPRIETDIQKHKPTRIAVEEILRGKINFTIEDQE